MTDKKSYDLLKEFYKVETMTIDEVNDFTGHQNPNTINRIASFLLADKLIEFVQTSDVEDGKGGWKAGPSYYRITILGRAYVEQRRRDLFSFWVPYAITTAIALASLFVALQGIGQQVVCSCCLG